jgi:ABC-2 type transport system ATP-binding protein
LTKRFPALLAVDHLSFSVVPGEIFGLVGPDGAGKTTTLRMLAGVMPPDEGTATVAGCDIARAPERAKHKLSYMPQRFGLYQELTVDENIRFYADLFGVRRGDHRPEVILLDEPTTGVDPVSRRDFWAILYSLLAEGVTILTSTAYLDEAERCHRVALLHEGRLLFCDTPAQLKARLPGAVLAVRSPEPRRLRAPLEQARGVSSLVLVGDGVHLVVDDAERRIPELRQQLAAAGVDFEDIVEVTPSMEDLFVSAVEKRSRGRVA